MENLNLMEERGGFTASASTETAEPQNSVTEPADSGGQVTPDTAFDTSRRPWTPGPWRWEFNQEYKKLMLCGGAKRFDLTVMDFARWGMGGATMRLRDIDHGGMNLLYKVHEREDWLSVQPGREHHKHWHMLVTHPDARLIEASPDLYEALEVLTNAVIQDGGNPNDDCAKDDDGCIGWDGEGKPLAVTFKMVRDALAALAKARGEG